MLDADRITDIEEISKYGKAKGFLVAKRYNLPTYSNFYIIDNEEDIQSLLDTYKSQTEFCMRSDTKIGDIPTNIGGQNGNRETIFEYFRKVKQKSNELGTKGVMIIYWNNEKFCPTYETDGCFYLDYVTNKELIIDYIGKGWDGTYLSHGSACHETYVIPWEDILFLDNNRIKYRRKIVGPNEYSDLRALRIKELLKNGFQKEIIEEAIPEKYDGIKDEYFREVVNQVIIPMYDIKDLQRYYKEYIPIAQIENGKVLVPEVILMDRLKYKNMSKSNKERE